MDTRWGLANFRPLNLFGQPSTDYRELNLYLDCDSHDAGLQDCRLHLFRHEISIFYDAKPNSQVVRFHTFRSSLCIVHKLYPSSYLTRLPCEPFSSERIPASAIDADEIIIHSDYGSVRTLCTQQFGLIGINISVIDFDPNSGMPVDYLVA